MKFFDIISMSITNLWRRKLRTVLTVLGVIIGTASVVVMLSLGLGLRTSLVAEAESYGALTAITVYSNANFSGDSASLSQYITDNTIEELSNMEHVKAVSPMLSMDGVVSQGKYETYVSICGVDQEYLDKIPLGEGVTPTKSSNMEMLIGNQIITYFYDKSNNEGYWDTGELPKVDIMGRPLRFKFGDDYASDENGNLIKKQQKDYVLPVAGMVEGDENSWGMYSNGIYTNIDSMKEFMKKNFKGEPIPGQPVDKQGKSYKKLTYSQLTVDVDDSENVDAVMDQIIELGFQANSNQEFIEQTKSTFAIVQAVLGGIGAVSLLVAAIGIANTMTMSTYERTKEIGIMKVIGCSLSNIQTMFLSEAAFIGMIGGVIGVMISKILSIIANILCRPFLTEDMGLGGGSSIEISMIPLWLVIVSIVFATMVGIVAGFFPARRASRLSALAAIRNE